MAMLRCEEMRFDASGGPGLPLFLGHPHYLWSFFESPGTRPMPFFLRRSSSDHEYRG